MLSKEDLALMGKAEELLRKYQKKTERSLLPQMVSIRKELSEIEIPEIPFNSDSVYPERILSIMTSLANIILANAKEIIF